MSIEDTIRNNLTLDFKVYFEEELKVISRPTYVNKAHKPVYTDRDPGIWFMMQLRSQLQILDINLKEK